VIDLDAAVRDPAVVAPAAAKLLKDYAEPLWVGVDYLHLNATGYKKMGDSVDLALFK
jgi:lysophospholipase L1-like esterase